MKSSQNHCNIYRDLGEYLRKQLKATLRAGNIPTNGVSSMDQQFQALERLSNNVYFNKYPRLRDSTATGLTSEQCKILISDSSLKYFADEEKSGLFSSLFGKKKKQETE